MYERVNLKCIQQAQKEKAYGFEKFAEAAADLCRTYLAHLELESVAIIDFIIIIIIIIIINIIIIVVTQKQKQMTEKNELSVSL